MRLDLKWDTQGQEPVSVEWTSPEEEEVEGHAARATKAREPAYRLQVGSMPEAAARQKPAWVLEALVVWEKWTQEEAAEGPAAVAADQEAVDMTRLKPEKVQV
jgi:hypothetical protein